MRRVQVIVVLLLTLSVMAYSQDKSDKFGVLVTGLGDAAPVVQALIRTMNASKPFAAVTKDDQSKVVVLISCMEHKAGVPYVCMYVSHLNGATSKTFLGGGMQLGNTASDVADKFLSSIAQDVVERFDETSTQNLREGLEACLLMTESKCNVPDPLQKELGATQLTLGQYLLKKNK